MCLLNFVKSIKTTDYLSTLFSFYSERLRPDNTVSLQDQEDGE